MYTNLVYSSLEFPRDIKSAAVSSYQTTGRNPKNIRLTAAYFHGDVQIRKLPSMEVERITDAY
jgi:hypothetical protein